MKININGLYETLGSPAALRQFEEALLRQLQETLEWRRRRIEGIAHNARLLENAAHQIEATGTLPAQVSAELDRCSEQPLGQRTKIKLAAKLYQDHAESAWEVVEFNKFEWTTMVAIVKTLIGDEPGDNQPIDTAAITAVLADYNKWNLADDDYASTTEAVKGAPGLREAIKWALTEVGDPGRSVHWKVFNAAVWTRCGVDPDSKGYRQRTIRRLVSTLRG